MDRYARQARLAGIGEDGQNRIRAGSVLLVGLGGLGCPAASYLVAAGVGRLAIMDDDVVDASNLHRQTLYAVADVGALKVAAASHRLHAMNPDVRIEEHAARFTKETLDIVGGFDVVVDGTDDLETKLLLAAACRAARVPLVHGAAAAWEGLVTVFDPPETPCYHCVWPKPQPGPTCADVGILGPVAGVIGALQAQEALKLLAGSGHSLKGRLLLYDGLSADATTVDLKKRIGCECHMPVACPLPWNAPTAPDISVMDYEARKSEFFLLDVREPEEFEEVRIPGSKLIPLGELAERLDEVPKDAKVVVHCAVGGRSARATMMLREHGVNALNLRGGIRAWLSLHA